MAALKILGLFCIILVCFGLPAYLIIEVYKKGPKRDSKGKIIPKMNQTTYWDFLILIIPIWLILIILFSNNDSEKAISTSIVSLGYTLLILTSNRFINIPKTNLFLVIICVLLALTKLFLQYKKLDNYSIYTEDAFIGLYFPAIAYLYLITARKLIFTITKTYPIMLDKYSFPIGSYFSRYQRNTNYWDLAWTVFTFCFAMVAPIVFIAKFR